MPPAPRASPRPPPPKRTNPTGQFVKDMAELPSDDKAVGFNAAAIKTRDQMLGTLLDMVA